MAGSSSGAPTTICWLALGGRYRALCTTLQIVGKEAERRAGRRRSRRSTCPCPLYTRAQAKTTTARPRNPSTGSKALTTDRDEEIFAAAFDGRIIRRFLGLRGTPLPDDRLQSGLPRSSCLYADPDSTIPLVIRDDHRRRAGRRRAPSREPAALDRRWRCFSASWDYQFHRFQLLSADVRGRRGSRRSRMLVDMRRAMYGHLQRVSLSFMDKTEVGRLMSRLQGDVNVRSRNFSKRRSWPSGISSSSSALSSCSAESRMWSSAC